jgi:predicted RecB family nuclease
MVNDAPARSKQHTVYKLSDGTKVPGVTTILGVKAKPALIKWANNLGLQGIDSNKYVDEKAQIGTLAHRMIEDYLNKVETDTSEYTKVQIDKAENSFLKFLEWEKSHKVEVILAEVPLVSESLRYGGTIDCYVKLDNEYQLLDFKTSSGIYDEHIYQLAAYWMLLSSNDHPVEKARILRIGRDETEGFEERIITNIMLEWEIFKDCLSLYNHEREYKRSLK